ncbi:uncharacterized protein LOC129592849 [Paramacrobiotus metropolitanus]|uniref:uncharacterized protein LOC129592849 n=1 Tax=Paramacrobiotus metropolitanus TaxID=2943436 RepID=UPI00244561EF|nr:uncharacterized protein LOC129592849 [Paramacrobiotus metropolitanus]XP_055344958.1 uncharacterized protein LOC129592849 [Paramacrobiotus metropolitanus]XP_055344959.1 uncharacterized protein LOC129592849 [Paramacrobiotus metropolitanus]XP_055344960.1 uncharacterized protein LOC129592849 [Paramacrobiotus metropolitanus]
MDEKKKQLIFKLRDAGYNQKKIAKRVGIGLNALRRFLRRETLFRLRTARIDEEKLEILPLLHQQTCSLTKIANQFSMSFKTLNQMRRTAGVPDEQKKSILPLFYRGDSRADIMREVKMEGGAGNPVLVHYANQSFTTRDKIRVNQEQKAEILKCFDEGHSELQIREQFDLSKATLKMLLRQNGKTFGERYRQNFQKRRAAALQLRAQGMSINAIAKQLKVSASTISRQKQPIGHETVTLDKCSQYTASLELKKVDAEPASEAQRPDEHGGHDTETTCVMQNDIPDTKCQHGARCDQTATPNHGKRTTALSRLSACIIDVGTVEKASKDNSEVSVLCSENTHTTLEYYAKTDTSYAGVDRNIAPAHFPSGQIKQQKGITESSRVISTDHCIVETTPKVSFLQPVSVTLTCRNEKYQCQTCHFTCDEEEAFLLHLAGKEHSQLSATGTFLHCTGCKFRTRKPATMGQHIIKYQSWQNALQYHNLHSVKI